MDLTFLPQNPETEDDGELTATAANGTATEVAGERRAYRSAAQSASPAFPDRERLALLRRRTDGKLTIQRRGLARLVHLRLASSRAESPSCFGPF